MFGNYRRVPDVPGLRNPRQSLAGVNESAGKPPLIDGPRSRPILDLRLQCGTWMLGTSIRIVPGERSLPTESAKALNAPVTGAQSDLLSNSIPPFANPPVAPCHSWAAITRPCGSSATQSPMPAPIPTSRTSTTHLVILSSVCWAEARPGSLEPLQLGEIRDPGSQSRNSLQHP